MWVKINHKGENNLFLSFFRRKEILPGCVFGFVELCFNFGMVVTPID